jgi:alkaline phosphatase D
VLDTRQYRTDQPQGDGKKPPSPVLMDPAGTLMGEKQRNWLFGGLEHSPASWNVIAQQVMMARADVKAGPEIAYSMDQWPGYEFERRRVLRHLHDKKIVNPVVISGDIHSNWASHLIADFDDLDSQVVAPEFVGTSMTSGGDGSQVPKWQAPMLAENPFVKFHNDERGYVRCELTEKTWKTEYKTVPYVSRPGAPLNTRAAFVVESGRPELNRV